MHRSADDRPELTPEELLRLRQELADWSFTGLHHLHKRWQFHTCQQALDWIALAKDLCARHGGDCDFYLANVGEGRIDTDIINRRKGHLERDDLGLAAILNALERDVKGQDRQASIP